MLETKVTWRVGYIIYRVFMTKVISKLRLYSILLNNTYDTMHHDINCSYLIPVQWTLTALSTVNYQLIAATFIHVVATLG